MMDKIFGIFSVVDHYNKSHKSFPTPLHCLNPREFSFFLKYWPWAFRCNDRFGRKRAKWGKYESSKIPEYLYQRIFNYHQSWRNHETFFQSPYFIVCWFETKMSIYSVLFSLNSCHIALLFSQWKSGTLQSGWYMIYDIGIRWTQGPPPPVPIKGK